MANKQAFQFWYEKERYRDKREARSVTSPQIRLPESPPRCTRTQTSGVVATLKLKWEQVPDGSRREAVEPSASSESRFSQSGNVMSDRRKKFTRPSLLEGAHENRCSASLKSLDSRGTAKKILTKPSSSKCERSRYGSIAQVF